MNTETDIPRLIKTVKAQLQSDLFLGGRWLPIGTLKPSGAKLQTTPSVTKGALMPAKQDSAVSVEKQQRLTVVAEAVAQCKKCPLHQMRLNTVPGQGSADARIVFVGEGPGRTEDEQGLAFVGRAGNLLTSIINAMGLGRQDVFIGNIIKCRPPNNRDPQAGEIVACIDYLIEQLDIIEPDIIVALGAHAARTLLESSSSIGQLRGRVHEYRSHPMAAPTKLVATYHPAYLLRNYTTESRRRVWQDMQMVLTELGLPIPARKSR